MPPPHRTGVVVDPMFSSGCFFSPWRSQNKRSSTFLCHSYSLSSWREFPLEFELFHKKIGWSRGFLSGEKSLPCPYVKAYAFLYQEKSKAGVDGLIIPGLTVTAHEDRHIRFFDNKSGKQTHSMMAHMEAVTSLAIDSNGLYLISGSKWRFQTISV